MWIVGVVVEGVKRDDLLVPLSVLSTKIIRGFVESPRVCNLPPSEVAPLRGEGYRPDQGRPRQRRVWGVKTRVGGYAGRRRGDVL